MTLLDKKSHHFTGRRKTFTPLGEGAETKTEETLDYQTTVDRELAWISDHLAASVDASLHLALANCGAKADIVTEDGVTLMTGVPASGLLEMEQTVNGLIQIVAKIPTLDPAKGFVEDLTQGTGVFKARTVEKVRTVKTSEPITLAPPTDKHAAQVVLQNVDKKVGDVREDEWATLWTVAHKAAVLTRLEALGRAVKRARMRANETLVDTTVKPGAEFIRYAFGLTT